MLTFKHVPADNNTSAHFKMSDGQTVWINRVLQYSMLTCTCGVETKVCEHIKLITNQ